MIRNVPIATVRSKLTVLSDQLNRSHDTITVTRRGKPVLAILPWEEYESITETLEIMGDKRLMAALRQGIRELKAGKGIAWEQAKKTLGL